MSKNTLQPRFNSGVRDKAVSGRRENIAPASSSKYPLQALTLMAVALPFMWGFAAPPLPAFYSQALACALWACAVLVHFLFFNPTRGSALHSGNMQAMRMGAPWCALLALLLLQCASGQSLTFQVAPSALAIALSLLITVAVSGARSDDQHRDAQWASHWLAAVLAAILLAALFNAWAVIVQALAPGWPDDVLIARHDGGERFGGNLRQPNQLATLMVWGLIAAAHLLRERSALWIAASAPLVGTLLASQSRTGIISVILVAAIGLRHSQRLRAWRLREWSLLLLGLAVFIAFSLAAFTRGTADSSMTQRLTLWREVIALTAQHPWFGVGWGQLNFAWTLTPFAQRAPDVFDHAHSLPLQLAVEVGLPATALILGLFGWGAWRKAQALRLAASREQFTVAVLLVVIVVHSLLEHPLWFSYFLLPTAFLYAWLLRQPFATAPSPASQPEARAAVAPAPPQRRLQRVVGASASLLCLMATAYGVSEYQKATAIHQSSRNSGALATAVAAARQSPVYGHFGDYAAIMLAGDRADIALFARPVHHVLDERMLTAWARAMQRSGDHERANYLISRAREFPPHAGFDDLPPLMDWGARSKSSPAAALGPKDFSQR